MLRPAIRSLLITAVAGSAVLATSALAWQWFQTVPTEVAANATYVGGHTCTSATSQSTSSGTARTTTGPWRSPLTKPSSATSTTPPSRLGVTTRFFRRDGKFMVNTEGPDGQNHDYEIKYTFGVDPLQQYMVEFPDGRVQVLRVSWDMKNKQWFDVTPPDVHERTPPAGRPAPLDRHRPELEHHLRRVPFDQFPEELRPGDEHVSHDVQRDRRQLRRVPRAGERPRRARQAAGRRSGIATSATAWRT